MKTDSKRTLNPSRTGWVFLLMAIVALAAVLRFWQLGAYPAGLYRDEAFNGLDALGVLDGERPIFFMANNGREPGYIYLTAVSIALFGRSIFALRFAAALAGTLVTLLVYLLAKSWFDRLTGLIAAFLWATTLWAVHLSRIGLRAILLIACLTLMFWLATEAYKRRNKWLWLAAGMVYGLGFYTYLAVRFTPLLLGVIVLYLFLAKFLATPTPTLRTQVCVALPLEGGGDLAPSPSEGEGYAQSAGGEGEKWRGLLWFGLGTAVIILPLIIYSLQNPEIILGRSGQVSIFSETINHGDLPGTFVRHLGQALGMFVWRGDTILRHNPAGRPVFDWLMVVPFVVGLVWCMRHWRQAGAAITLLWVGVMLWPTILAEDAPHFLRAVGVLPAVLFLPAVGLAVIWRWQRLPSWLARGAVIVILVSSLSITIFDYVNYSRDPETQLLFERAATELAYEIGAEDGDTAVYLDRWFWDEATQKGWSSIPFLADLSAVHLYRPEFGLPTPQPDQPISIYAWKFYDQEFVPQTLSGARLVQLRDGALARGDLEAEAYPLYIRIHGEPTAPEWQNPIRFGDEFVLYDTDVRTAADELEVDLVWGRDTAVTNNLTAFVQIVGLDGVLAQSDLPPGGGNWQPHWWRAGQAVQETRTIVLPVPFERARHIILVGVYDPATLERLPIWAEDGSIRGDSWQLPVSE